MAERVQKQRGESAERDGAVGELPAAVDREVVELTDDILDEIDGLLEENAAAFVQAYVQKGGE